MRVKPLILLSGDGDLETLEDRIAAMSAQDLAEAIAYLQTKLIYKLREQQDLTEKAIEVCEDALGEYVCVSEAYTPLKLQAFHAIRKLLRE